MSSKIIIIALVAQIIHSLSLPANNTSFAYPNFRFGYYLTSSTIQILIQFNRYNFFGLAYQPTMINTDMSIVAVTGTNVLLGEYYSQSETTPNYQNHNALTVIGTQTDGSTYVNILFERPLNPNNPNCTVLKVNQSFSFVVAWSSSQNLSFHGSNLQYISGILSNTVPSNSSNTTNSSTVSSNTFNIPSDVKTHAILMTLCWFFFADIAVFLITYRYRKYTYWLHGLLMTMCVIITVSLALAMLYKKGGLKDIELATLGIKTHLVIAIICMSWLGFQIVMGLITRSLQYYTTLNPRWILGFVWIHKHSGYALILLLKINVLIGWYQLSNIAFILLLVHGIIFIFLFILRHKREIKISGAVYTPQSILTALNNQIMHDALIKHPYNSPNLDQYHYIIFNDYVWDLTEKNDEYRSKQAQLEGVKLTPGFGYHPGGNKIIQLIQGRQIDRFIYGMEVPEELPWLKPIVHSRRSLEALGSPIFRLANHKTLFNASSILDQTKYILISKQEFSPGHYVFEFKSTKQKLFFHQPINLSFIGQYYTVIASGKSRMYTSIVCLRKQHRDFSQATLWRLGYPIEKAKRKKMRLHTQKQLDLGTLPTERILSKVELQGESIPLMMKKCELSKRLLDDSESTITITGQLGRGLSFDKLEVGTIVIIMGGTGIAPFLDLFDLLFKYTLIISKKIENNLIAAQSNILKQYPDLFNGFKFVVYGAFHELSDIINISQLLFLATELKQRFTITLRIRKLTEKTKDFKKILKNEIRFTDHYFNQQFVEKNIQNVTDLSMIYICGPPRMSRVVLNELVSFQRSKIYLV